MIDRYRDLEITMYFWQNFQLPSVVIVAGRMNGCSDDEEEEVRSHSRGSARSDTAPEGALVLNEDSMDSDRGGALNLVNIYSLLSFSSDITSKSTHPSLFLSLWHLNSKSHA